MLDVHRSLSLLLPSAGLPKRIPLSIPAATFVAIFAWTTAAGSASRPNILWIIADDISQDLGCNGNQDVATPNLDRLATEGALFTAAFTTAPVCSASRSAFQTGAYQTQIGAHNHRSHRNDGYVLPAPHQLLSQRLRAAGYYTANLKTIGPDLTVRGKTDFNFRATGAFDGSDWSDLKRHQPFFAQVNFLEPHRGEAWRDARRQDRLVDPRTVTLPVDYPDDTVTRDVWANYCDAINLLDRKVGVVLDQLARDQLAENTLVVFFGDNGRPLFRGKTTLYEQGINIPLIVRWPGRIEPGSVRRDMVSAIDFAPAMLAAAGVEPPAILPGADFLSPDHPIREFVFAARDRIDEIPDTIRAVRTPRYKYIRNFRPGHTSLEESAHTRREFPELEVFRDLDRRRLLTPAQHRVVELRPAEELYDLQADPHELQNLAGDPEHQLLKEMLHHVLMDWVVENRDAGAIPETSVVMPDGWYKRNGVDRLPVVPGFDKDKAGDLSRTPANEDVIAKERTVLRR